MCERSVWARSDDAHVLPADVDPEDPTLVPAEETEFADRLENTFDCPNCGAGQTGYPVECTDCGAPYSWN